MSAAEAPSAQPLTQPLPTQAPVASRLADPPVVTLGEASTSNNTSEQAGGEWVNRGVCVCVCVCVCALASSHSQYFDLSALFCWLFRSLELFVTLSLSPLFFFFFLLSPS